MIFPTAQFPVDFGATMVRGSARAKRAQILATMPSGSPTPYVNTSVTTSLGPRRDIKRAKRQEAISASGPLGPFVNVGTDPRIGGGPKKYKQTKPVQCINPPCTGGEPTPTSTGAALCALTTQTLRKCHKCCKATPRGPNRLACMIECDKRFLIGGGTCIQGRCEAGFCDTGSNCCPQGGGGPCKPYPGGGGGGGTPGPSGQNCGIVCVSGTSGDAQTCHWECFDYGTPPTPTSGGGGLPVSYPEIGGGTVAGPLPGSVPESELTGTFWDNYKWPIIGAAGAVALILIMKKKRGGR